MNFAKAAARYKASGMGLDDGDGYGTQHTTLTPTDRPTVHQPDVATDGLDPAAIGGPAPMNSGQGPYGAPVASDPLLQAPIMPGMPIPHVQGPDVDTTVLK